MNRAPFFPTKFTAPAVDGVAQAAASYQLATFIAGSDTDAITYADADGLTPNANPVPLDENGECDLFLDPTIIYKFILLLPIAQGSGEVRVYNDVVPVAGTTDVVTSVNGETGAVTLTAEDVPYTPTDDLDWYAVASVSEALDAIAGHFTDITAADVPIVDAGGFYPPEDDNVEDALQYIGEQLNQAAAGRFLRLTVITATGNWVAGEDTGHILVKMVGGGGGGFAGGGGGGGGGYSERYIAAPTSPSLVTIGAGGLAGTNGADTVFGTYMTAGGGRAATTVGGSGGTSTGGDLNLKGGGGGARAEDAGGDGGFGTGGNSYFGGGGRAGPYPTGAEAGGTNTGGGGSGGNGAGGVGGSGIALVYEYT